MYSVFVTAALYLGRDSLKLIVENNYVVGVPANRTGNVKKNSVKVLEHAGNLVGNNLCRVEVTCIECKESVVLERAAHIELM